MVLDLKRWKTNNQYIYFHSFLFLYKSQTFRNLFYDSQRLFKEGKDVIFLKKKLAGGTFLDAWLSEGMGGDLSTCDDMGEGGGW